MTKWGCFEMNSESVSSIPHFIRSLEKITWEWMDWTEYPYPSPPIPCVPGMVGTHGNVWERMPGMRRDLISTKKTLAICSGTIFKPP